MNVGDLSSTAKGSGARFNAGKPPVDLIPLILIAEGYGYVRGMGTAAHIANSGAVTALGELGMFQCGAGIASLHNAFAALGMPWMECASVFDFGRKKYAAWNWSKGMQWSVPLACAGRHLIEMIEGGTEDRDSHLPVVGHVACNLVMLMTFITTYPEGDDRPVATLSALAAPQTPAVVKPEPAPFKIDGLGDYVMRNGVLANLDFDAANAFGGSHPRTGQFGRYRGSWHTSGAYLDDGTKPLVASEYDIVRKYADSSVYGPLNRTA
ncbi:dATP/dGTP diphosphohydrolase domain-containing protein [Nevskia ramosa]|uniref:dATP/dGTP diphosphohydrolase domain-containing protein n=1 Tax=Nevskia ramosa TaxID=64002 RepID=UPI003D0BFEC5